MGLVRVHKLRVQKLRVQKLRVQTRCRERGSALMLFPAAVLIIILLASLCVDATLTFLGQREIANAAEAAANDAASALDRDRYYDASVYDLAREDGLSGIVQVGNDAIRARIDDKVKNVSVRIVRTDGTHVRVEITGEVSLIFAKAIPGASRTVVVHASAEAEAQQR